MAGPDEREPEPSLGPGVEQAVAPVSTCSYPCCEDPWTLKRRHSKAIVEDLTRFLVTEEVRWVGRTFITHVKTSE